MVGRWYLYNPPIGSTYHLYTTYILPIGWLYAPYHLLREPGNSIDITQATCLDDPKCYAWANRTLSWAVRKVSRWTRGGFRFTGVKYDTHPNVMQDYSREMHGNAHVSTRIKFEILPAWGNPIYDPWVSVDEITSTQTVYKSFRITIDLHSLFFQNIGNSITPVISQSFLEFSKTQVS